MVGKNTLIKFSSARERARVINNGLVSMASFECAAATVVSNTTGTNAWPVSGTRAPLAPGLKLYGDAGGWAEEDGADGISLAAGIYVVRIGWQFETDNTGSTYKWALTDSSDTYIDGSGSADYFTVGDQNNDHGVMHAVSIIELGEAQVVYFHIAAHAGGASKSVRGSGSSVHIQKVA
jgi:hypothetical protein